MEYPNSENIKPSPAVARVSGEIAGVFADSTDVKKDRALFPLRFSYSCDMISRHQEKEW